MFDVRQRSLGFVAAGASLSMSSTFEDHFAAYGGDNLADPVVQSLAFPRQVANTGCGGRTSDHYSAVFPGGAPANVSTVIFVNRRSDTPDEFGRRILTCELCDACFGDVRTRVRHFRLEP